MNDRFQALRKIAPKLNELQKDPNARVHYELMSDALVWSDELPPWDELDAGETHCLRGVWRFRTTLILSQPEERLRAGWDYLRTLCPNWPGFAPERQQPDPARADFFEQARAKGIAQWEALDTRIEPRASMQPRPEAATRPA